MKLYRAYIFSLGKWDRSSVINLLINVVHWLFMINHRQGVLTRIGCLCNTWCDWTLIQIKYTHNTVTVGLYSVVIPLLASLVIYVVIYQLPCDPSAWLQTCLGIAMWGQILSCPLHSTVMLVVYLWSTTMLHWQTTACFSTGTLFSYLFTSVIVFQQLNSSGIQFHPWHYLFTFSENRNYFFVKSENRSQNLLDKANSFHPISVTITKKLSKLSCRRQIACTFAEVNHVEFSHAYPRRYYDTAGSRNVVYRVAAIRAGGVCGDYIQGSKWIRHRHGIQTYLSPINHNKLVAN